jgi:tRNA threonylcarbamoyladenosine modification (KEOPS) complex Cgi121 subunit
MDFTFDINKSTIYIKNIYCSIDINNIESYLKRIGDTKKDQKKKFELILIPNNNIFSAGHINWAIFIAKSRFDEKTNIASTLWKEVLLTLNLSDQVNRLSNEWHLKEGKNKEVFFIIVSEEKTTSAEVKKITEKLDIKEIKTKTINFKTEEAKKFYRVEDPGTEEKIIEKMAISIL